MSSQVVTFYEDEAKTNALYPRTKISAISDDNGKALSETIDKFNNKTRINYLRPIIQTQTKGGITCINNGDGTYTVNGTNTSSWNAFDINSLKYNINKTIRLTGGNGNVEVVIWDTVNNVLKAESNGSTPNVTVTLDADIIYNVSILIMEKTTFNNIIVKPMITDDLSATYDDFVSYDDSLAVNSLAAQKSDVLSLEEIQASTDLSGKIASASSIKDIIDVTDMHTWVPNGILQDKNSIIDNFKYISSIIEPDKPRLMIIDHSGLAFAIGMTYAKSANPGYAVYLLFSVFQNFIYIIKCENGSWSVTKFTGSLM